MHRRQAGEVLTDVGGRASILRWAVLQERQAVCQVASILVDIPGNDVWLKPVVERLE